MHRNYVHTLWYSTNGKLRDVKLIFSWKVVWSESRQRAWRDPHLLADLLPAQKYVSLIYISLFILNYQKILEFMKLDYYNL
jgi:hypothetical protein